MDSPQLIFATQYPPKIHKWSALVVDKSKDKILLDTRKKVYFESESEAKTHGVTVLARTINWTI